MKIDIAKNTWINEISVDFFKEGFWAGLLAVSISFSGGACPGEKFIAEVLSKLLEVDLPKLNRTVRFTGLFDPQDMDVALLLQSLKKYKFNVQAILPERFVAPWVDKLDWKIVRMDGKILLSDAQEIWYCPAESADLKEPTLPPEHGLLFITKGRSVAETVKFITNAKEVWRLL